MGVTVHSLAETTTEVLASIWARRRHTIVAAIIIGISAGAAVALMNVGQNARTELLRHLEEMGGNLVVVASLDHAPSGPQIGDLADDLAYDIPQIIEAAPISRLSASLRLQETTATADTIAVTESFFRVAGVRVDQGRLLSQFDEGKSYVLLGRSLATELSTATRPIVIGSVILLNGNYFQVAGILQSQPANLVLGIDTNRTAFLSSLAARKIVEKPLFDSIVLAYDRKVALSDIQTAISRWFSINSKSNVALRTSEQFSAAMEEQMAIYDYLLAGISIISTVISAISITGVLLLSVEQRRPEIGLRRAVGATTGDIVLLFLLEGGILGLAGCFVGTALGYAASGAYALQSGWSISYAPTSAILGIGVGTLVGLLSAGIPAIRAARLDPIDALRGQ